MEGDFLPFFADHQEAIPLYEALESRILSQLEGVTVKGSKTQLSFYNRHMFACVSFARVRRKKDCPPVFLVVTIGLGALPGPVDPPPPALRRVGDRRGADGLAPGGRRLCGGQALNR